MQDKIRFNVGYAIFAVFAMLFTNSGSRPAARRWTR